jgi:DNA-binding MarR family transcriptional regulator
MITIATLPTTISVSSLFNPPSNSIIAARSSSLPNSLINYCFDNCCIYNYIGLMRDKNISNLEDHIGYWLRCLSNYIHDNFAAKLAKYDITVASWVVLRSLYEHDDITLNKAAEVVGVDKSSLSRMIERLRQKKLVSRIMGKDRRSVNIKLTNKGKTLIPKLSRLADENDKEFFFKLSNKQQAELLSTIKLLLQTNGWNKIVRGIDRMH